MSADFWAGYVSGAAGILIGNPLDLIKTRLQAGHTVNTEAPSSSTGTSTGTGAASATASVKGNFDRAGALVRGSAAPILGYGALNALLFVSYNRTLALLAEDPDTPSSLSKIWLAGAVGGLATFVVSAPTELIKCRAQVSSGNINSWSIARDVWKAEGLRGLYQGGGVTSVRDAVGYGFYFWSYEWAKRSLTSPTDTEHQTTLKILFCGGLAGIVTWASIFPLDVIKTRVQTQVFHHRHPAFCPEPTDTSTLLPPSVAQHSRAHNGRRLGTVEIAKRAYRTEGLSVFFRGLGVCSMRAFVVNAVQWAVYEWMMQLLQKS